MSWVAAPLSGANCEVVGRTELANCGSLLRASPIVEGVLVRSCCAATTVTGEGAEKPSLITREPVTTMSLLPPSIDAPATAGLLPPPTAGSVASCAMAAHGMAQASAVEKSAAELNIE
ncbi:hypothetical protein M2345_002830 [Sphingobium sp. B8D3D]|nr:hypothetical protein [Sphingobium sp. B8D3D]